LVLCQLYIQPKYAFYVPAFIVYRPTGIISRKADFLFTQLSSCFSAWCQLR